MLSDLVKWFRRAFPKAQGAFVQADDVGDLHQLRPWLRFAGKPLPKPRKGCEGRQKEMKAG